MNIVTRRRSADQAVRLGRAGTPPQRHIDALAAVPCFGMELLERRLLYSGGDWTTFDRYGNTYDTEAVLALVVEPDGSAVVLERVLKDHNFELYRYHSDGSPDHSFGDRGTVRTDVTPGSDQAHSLTRLADGKYLVVGSTQLEGKPYGLLVRYNADGSLDDTFGNGGVAVHDLGLRQATLAQAMVGSDGTITVTGEGRSGESGAGTILLARFKSDGSVDTTFSDDGVVLANFDGQGVDLALRSDGSVVVLVETRGGWVVDALAGFNADGSVDTTFGVNGRAVIDFRLGGAMPTELTALDDGRLLVSGLALEGPQSGAISRLAAARFGADGALDDSFGDNGVTVVGNGTDLPVDEGGMAVRADGSIVLAGAQRTLENNGRDPAHGDVLLALLDPDGRLDTSFGVDGIITRDFGRQEWVADVTLADDGTIVIAGSDQYANFIARYDPTAPAPAPQPAPEMNLPVTGQPAGWLIIDPVGGRLLDQPIEQRHLAPLPRNDWFVAFGDDVNAAGRLSAFSLLSATSDDLSDGVADEDELLVE